MRGFCLEVRGPYACFTRPEMKVERVSYDVITPSAARGIFEAILWKPAIRWRITRIDVMAPIRWISVRRNEVGSVASTRATCIFADDHKTRQQRSSLLLRSVRYRLHAEFDFITASKRPRTINPTPKWLSDIDDLILEERMDESEAKYAAMFERRARKGQCFTPPYLGCREFACSFQLLEQDQDYSGPISESRDLGWMLYDLDFSNPKDAKPMWYRPQMEGGSIAVPHPDSEEVRR